MREGVFFKTRALPKGNTGDSRSTFANVLYFGIVHVMSICELHSQILVQIIKPWILTVLLRVSAHTNRPLGVCAKSRPCMGRVVGEIVVPSPCHFSTQSSLSFSFLALLMLLLLTIPCPAPTIAPRFACVAAPCPSSSCSCRCSLLFLTLLVLLLLAQRCVVF